MAYPGASSAEPEIVLDFLRRTLPFSDLGEKTLAWLARQCLVDFQPKGARILSRGVTDVEGLFIIQQGGVRLYLCDDAGEENLADFRGEGDTVGGLALLRGGRADMDAETVEDTFFFVLPKQVFLELFEQHPFIAQHFVRDFSDNYIAKAFDELRGKKLSAATESGLYLFSTRLGDLVGRDIVTLAMGSTIQDAAMRMYREGVGSLCVTDPSGEINGIVTDKDLRKAVALGMDHGATIETIMSTPVLTMDAGSICFDALFTMMSRNIHHLAVERGGTVAGMVTSHDIMVMQGKSPMALFREIKAQRTFEGLYPLGGKAPQLIRTLVEEGAKAGHITRMVAVLNDMLLERCIELLTEELGPAPAPFTFLLMGSEGRREQTFATDQDNALVWRDSGDEIVDRAAAYYFTVFTEKLTEHLVCCGFPRCPGGIMASNPKWRQPFPLWRGYFEDWITVPEPQEILNATIFFDFRCGHGDLEMAESLRNHVARHAAREEVFLRFLAADCLKMRPPLSFFKNFIVEKDGAHRNTLDIKTRGITPFTDFARVLALKHGIRETNTLGRLDALAGGGHLSNELYIDTREAYEFLMQLRIVHQLELVEQGRVPDNHFDPAKLSELEKRTLKEAFAVIGRIQSLLKEVFRLDMV
ncbi:MAG: putative nucleotidyltransferase substrate binding domain-containing protein [Desulfovibrionaceae bacterium]